MASGHGGVPGADAHSTQLSRIKKEISKAERLLSGASSMDSCSSESTCDTVPMPREQNNFLMGKRKRDPDSLWDELDEYEVPLEQIHANRGGNDYKQEPDVDMEMCCISRSMRELSEYRQNRDANTEKMCWISKQSVQEISKNLNSSEQDVGIPMDSQKFAQHLGITVFEQGDRLFSDVVGACTRKSIGSTVDEKNVLKTEEKRITQRGAVDYCEEEEDSIFFLKESCPADIFLESYDHGQVVTPGPTFLPSNLPMIAENATVS